MADAVMEVRLPDLRRWTGLVLIGLGVCLWTTPAHAAVALDCGFEKGTNASVSSYSFVSNAGTVSCTPPANANRVLICYLSIFRGGGSPTTAAAITWAAVSLTGIGTKQTIGTNIEMWQFGLIAPASGSNTIAATWTGGGEAVVDLACQMFSGADQTTGWSDPTPATGTSTSATVTVPNVVSGDASSAARVDENASSNTQTAGTNLWDEQAFNGNYGGAYRLSNGTISWTLGSSVNWIEIGVRVIASGGGGGCTRSTTLTTLGVGTCKG